MIEMDFGFEKLKVVI